MKLGILATILLTLFTLGAKSFAGGVSCYSVAAIQAMLDDEAKFKYDEVRRAASQLADYLIEVTKREDIDGATGETRDRLVKKINALIETLKKVAAAAQESVKLPQIKLLKYLKLAYKQADNLRSVFTEEKTRDERCNEQDGRDLRHHDIDPLQTH